jgi:uncharacterized damage-inducible protein DinB
MHATLLRLLQYKAWADDQLLTALAGVDRASPVVALSIKALSHTFVVDRIFLAHLKRERHGFASANLSELPALDALSRDLRDSDRELVDYVAALDARALHERIEFRFTDGARGCMSRAEMLMHLITHGVGHRGQVSAVMLLHSLAPATDGFTTYLHETEARERGRRAA